MPKFHMYLLSAAHGFHNTCSSIDHLVASNQQDFVELLASSISSNGSLVIKLSDDKQQRYSNELRWIQYVAKAWKHSNPTPSIEEVKDALNCNTSLKPGSVDSIVSALEASVAAANPVKGGTCNAVVYRQSSSKLINFSWKVGIALRSSRCSVLNHPYVAISFDILKASGEVIHHQSELTYNQFQKFKSNFEKVAATMDSL